jgi:hypothetical protein
MVKKFLKIAGVKSEAEFYKKYPSEAAFFKAHPEAKDLKQYKQGGQQKKLNQLTSFEGDIDNIMPIAQIGSVINQTPAAQPFQPIDFQGIRDSYDKQFTGSTEAERQAAQQEAQAAAQPQGGGAGGGGGMDMSQIMKMMGGAEGGAGGADALASLPIGKKGKKLKKGQGGMNLNSPAGGAMTGVTAANTNPYMWNSTTNLGEATPPTAADAGITGTPMDQSQIGSLQEQSAQSQNAVPVAPAPNVQYPTAKAPTSGAYRTADKLANNFLFKGLGSTIYKGIRKIQAQKEKMKQAEQQKALSDLTLQVSMLRPEQTEKKYVRPEDTIIQPEQLSPSYGVGTNYLARNGSILKAQDGVSEFIRSNKIVGCKGGVNGGCGSTAGEEGKGEYVPLSNAPATWEELQTYNETNPKSKEFKSQLKSLQSQFPGLTAQQLLAAGADSARVNLRKQDLQRYDKPSEQTFDKSYHMFYRPLMDQPGRVTVPQILQQQPGGFFNYEQNVRSNYGRKKAQDGMQIGGNPTEIQNMYNPGDIYEDLGYEPLGESDVIKQYQGGGGVPWDMLGSSGQQAASAITGPSAGGEVGGDIGGEVGQMAGNAIAPGVGGPIGKAIGQIGGSLIGGLLDKTAKKTERLNKQTQKNVQKAAAYSAGQAIQGQYSAHVKNGGWVSHDWQPQVITKFGEYDVEDLLKEDPTMDTLRTGGHIRQNYSYPQDQFNLGGSLQTTWGGYAEPISQNPYLPGTGETVMFRGNSHEEGDGKGRTGIGVKYGGDDGEYSPYMEYGRDGVEDVTDVEVERGEPAIEMPDTDSDAGTKFGYGGEKKSMVVYGNLIAPKQFLPQAEGKKFKNYVKDLSQKEEKINKSLDKDVNALNNMQVYTPFDKLKMDALQANLIGKNMKLKEIADDKMEAAFVQSALHDTSKEYGLDVDALAKGKVKIDKKAQQEMARFGKEIFKAQDGTTTPPSTVDQAKYAEIKRLYERAKTEGAGGKKSKSAEEFQKKFHEYFPEFAKDVILSSPKGVTAKGKGKYKTIEELKNAPLEDILSTNVDQYFGPRTEQYMAKLQKPTFTPQKIQTTPGMPQPKFKDVPRIPEEKLKEIPQKPKFPWEDLVNQVLPYTRPSDVDYNVDLSPEMMALSMNQLDPVPAQLYQPQLLTPYDISLQDQLNEVTAQSRSAERMAGGDPSALASIMGQASRAKSNILGEQFRQNQAQRMGVYNQNIGTLNDAKLKNLAILDEQAKRKAMAETNTKAQAQAAANSISDKIAKNKLENRTLQTYENLYNFRYDDQGRALNYNPLAQFNTTVGQRGSSSGLPNLGSDYEWDTSPRPVKKKKGDDTSRNGRIVKAMKGY